MPKDEGYWINCNTENFYQITDHAYWITQERNAILCDLPKHVYEQIKDLHPDLNRKEILVATMNEGFIRCRRYYNSTEVHFEFTMPTEEAIFHIGRFLERCELAGIGSYIVLLNISDLENPEVTGMPYPDFKGTWRKNSFMLQ